MAKKSNNEGRWLFQRKAAKRQRAPRRSATSRIDLPRPKRVVLDLAPLTFAEILDCVVERSHRYMMENKPVPHATQVALKMLHEASAK